MIKNHIRHLDLPWIYIDDTILTLDEWQDVYDWCEEQFGKTREGRWKYDYSLSGSAFFVPLEKDQTLFLLRWG